MSYLSSESFSVDQKTVSTSSSKLRLCLISPIPPPFGGIGRWTLLVQQWSSQQPGLFLSHVDISPRWRAIDDLSVWRRMIGGGLQLIRDYGRFLVAVRGADVIHLTTSGQLAIVRDIAISATARLLKKSMVYHLHFGKGPEIARTNTLEWRMLFQAIKLSNIVLVFDNDTAETISKYLPQKRIEIAPNPIDLSTLPIPRSSVNKKKSLLFLGWIIPSKGVEELLDAWQNLHHEDWELIIAGPGSQNYKDELLERYSPQGVRFVGKVSHTEALQMIADCDIFVLPSHTEAFPFAVLEAMALGRAIVATSVGAIPDMLAGECGILVAPKDPQSLLLALKSLLDDDALRAELGSRAREKAIYQYSLDTVMEKITAIWHSLLLKIV